MSSYVKSEKKSADLFSESEEGRLDGITLFRFAHCSKDLFAGGVEQYLGNLNRSLLIRNKMAIIQMYKTQRPERNIEVEQFGQGKLVWCPIDYKRK